MRERQKYFVINCPSSFSESGSVTNEKCISDEIDRAMSMGSRCNDE